MNSDHQARRNPLQRMPETQTSRSSYTQGAIAQKKASAAFFAVLVLLAILALILSSCAGSYKKSVTKPPAIVEQRIDAPFKPLTTIQACLDITGSYPKEYAIAAKNALATSLEKYVTPNIAGLTLYATWIRNNSWEPESTFYVATIPAIAADPLPPAGIPTSTPTGDPLTDAKNSKTVQETNNHNTTTYQASLVQSHLTLNKIKQSVQKQATQLRSLALPKPSQSGTDVWGCVERAASRFAGVSGRKELLIASDLENTLLQQKTQSLSLAGVVVKVVWFSCSDASSCTEKQSSWQQIFKQAGGSECDVFDPSQSSTLPSLFS